MATYYDLKPSYKDSNGDIHTIPTYAVDTVLNTESNNAIANSAVATALQGLQTATGNPVTITNAAPINAQEVKVAIEAVQDLNGYDKPWAGGAGKNKFDISQVVTLALANTIVARSDYRGWYMPVENGDTYTISRASTSQPIRFRICFTLEEPRAGISFYNSEGVSGYIDADSLTEQTVTVPNDKEYKYMFIYLSNSNETITEAMKIQVESGTSATSYEPYSNVCPITGWDALRLNVSGEDTSDPTTYTKSLTTTNYGGYWDATEGVIGTTHAIVDLGTLSWNYDSTYSRFMAKLTGMVNANARTLALMCTQYEPISDGRALSNVPDGGIYNGAYGNDTGIYIHDSRYTDATAFTTAVSGVHLKYPLATPTTSSTTPEEIPLSQGTNNLWADSGDVTVKHWPNNIIGQLVGLIQQSQS